MTQNKYCWVAPAQGHRRGKDLPGGDPQGQWPLAISLKSKGTPRGERHQRGTPVCRHVTQQQGGSSGSELRGDLESLTTTGFVLCLVSREWVRFCGVYKVGMFSLAKQTLIHTILKATGCGKI